MKIGDPRSNERNQLLLIYKLTKHTQHFNEISSTELCVKGSKLSFKLQNSEGSRINSKLILVLISIFTFIQNGSKLDILIDIKLIIFELLDQSQ